MLAMLELSAIGGGNGMPGLEEASSMNGTSSSSSSRATIGAASANGLLTLLGVLDLVIALR